MVRIAFYWLLGSGKFCSKNWRPCVFALVAGLATFEAPLNAADLNFYGRSGDAIALDFGALPGVSAGATFSGLSLTGFTGHTVLSSSDLNQGNFASDGKLWVMPNPTRNTAGTGDTDLDARGFQGVLTGSLEIGGIERSFQVTVQPGYTGDGLGAVQQSGERINRPANNLLYVAQQQQRLKYLGFVQEGGGALVVDGLFGPNTEASLRTFQAAFVAGFNTTQSSVDGIIGPNTAGWLNAANAPRWDEMIDPDPQTPGTFSVAGILGDYDILPGRDPGTGIRSGNTPQSERFGTDWAIDLWEAGAAAAKLATGDPLLMNALSTDDGYGSAAFHSTHRVGMDIDMHVDASTHNFGNGSVSSAEQGVIDAAVALIDAGNSGLPGRGQVSRIISSNQDILSGIGAARPRVETSFDSSGGHRNHLHIDVTSPDQVAGVANLPGDFNLDNVVDTLDYTLWRDNLGSTLRESDYHLWASSYGGGTAAGLNAFPQVATVPETGSLSLLLLACGGMVVHRRGHR